MPAISVNLQLEVQSAIPWFPDFRLLTIQDKNLVQRLLREQAMPTSEMTFTNLFTWSVAYPVQMTRLDEAVLFWRGSAEHGYFLPPSGVLGPSDIAAVLSWAGAQGRPPEFRRVSEAAAQALHQSDPKLILIDDRDQADYVYRRPDLATLAGRNYDGKRNQIKKFTRAVDAQYAPLTSEWLPGCLALQEEWCLERGCAEHPDLDAEDQAVFVALQNWDALDVFGGVLLADQAVIAFAIGEALTSDTAVVHFEKARGKYPGVYQALNQQFCLNAMSAFAFVNREQDLGVEGLRQAKLSYQPDHLVHKFVVKY